MEENKELFKKININWFENINELEDGKIEADIKLVDGESKDYKGIKMEFIGFTKKDGEIRARIEYAYKNQHPISQDFDQGRYESTSFYLFIHAFTYGLNSIVLDIGKKIRQI